MTLRTISPATRRRVAALVAAGALALLLAFVTGAASAAPSTAGTQAIQHRNVHVCATPLSGQATCFSILHQAVTSAGKPAPNASSPTGLSPATIQHVYGFSTSSAAGSGTVIAIVDAYDAPNIESDLNVFSSQYGLPECTTASGCFEKVDQTGGTHYPRTDSGWALEISLDVEWAHAIAPGAKILLVEAKSNSFSNLMAAEDYASAHAQYVSNSWGGSESSGETSYDSHFSRSGVSFFVSSGDSGLGAEYPSSSPNVVSVGGTSLTFNTDGSVTETGWSGSGGGCSSYETATTSQQSYSNESQVNCGSMRATPDVALDADPNSGVSVYDTTKYSGQSGWFTVGGTSASAPMWAARSADQGVVVDAAYVYGSNITFHDVTSGNNGASALQGYDLVTGLGSWDDGSVISTSTSSGGTSGGSSGGGTTQTVVHVPNDGIGYSAAKHGNAMIITVDVKDSNNQPVGGATVAISVTGPVSGSGSGTTGSDGTVGFRLNKAPSGSYTTNINSITGTNLTWDKTSGTTTYTGCYPSSPC